MADAARRRLPLAMTAGGTVLWLAYPLAWWAGIAARWNARCADRPFTGSFDACHNDALPLVEIGWSLLAWLLTPLFALAAWRLWRGAVEPRAPADHAVRYVASVGGTGWCLWNLPPHPLTAASVALDAYWIVFAAWWATLALVAALSGRRPLQ